MKRNKIKKVKASIIKKKCNRKQQRVFGQLKGKFTIPNDFNDENKEINKLFY